jgi:hypothetical protein
MESSATVVDGNSDGIEARTALGKRSLTALLPAAVKRESAAGIVARSRMKQCISRMQCI